MAKRSTGILLQPAAIRRRSRRIRSTASLGSIRLTKFLAIRPARSVRPSYRPCKPGAWIPHRHRLSALRRPVGLVGLRPAEEVVLGEPRLQVVLEGLPHQHQAHALVAPGRVVPGLVVDELAPVQDAVRCALVVSMLQCGLATRNVLYSGPIPAHNHHIG